LKLAATQRAKARAIAKQAYCPHKKSYNEE